VQARQRVSDYWDTHVARWLAGDDSLDRDLERWFGSYRGRGRGEVTRDGFVEPYQGDLAGFATEPKVVILGLNPGAFLPTLQCREGSFSNEIRERGPYSAWVREHPYDGPTWLAQRKPNGFYLARLNFTRRWLRMAAADYNAMLLFELYPWHSTGVTGPMRPDGSTINAFVWEPISEIAVDYVFAFGQPWARLADAELGLPCLARLGRGGDDYGSAVASRAVRIHQLPSGQRLVVEWHSGSAGPPNADEVEVLRAVLSRLWPSAR
jgi:hypothetical protein